MSSPGAVVMLLLAIFLLLSFFTGRLDWLFGMFSDLQAGYRTQGEPAPAATPATPTNTRHPRAGQNA